MTVGFTKHWVMYEFHKKLWTYKYICKGSECKYT